jgi:hypothetical protein
MADQRDSVLLQFFWDLASVDSKARIKVTDQKSKSSHDNKTSRELIEYIHQKQKQWISETKDVSYSNPQSLTNHSKSIPLI